MRFIFRGNRRPYGIPPPRPLLLSSSAMPCFLGTQSLCPPPPCPVSSARRVSALLRHVRSLRHAASLSPHRGHRITCCPPLHRFPPRPFPGIRPVSTLLMTDYPLLYLPCPGIPFLGIRPPPPPPFPVPSRPFLSLLVPSCPFFSPSRPLLCIPCFRPRPCRPFFREAGDFGMKMRNTSLFGK